MKTIHLTNPHGFPQALADSASETIIVLHGACRLVLHCGRVLSCDGKPDVGDVEPVMVDDPVSEIVRPSKFDEGYELLNDEPTADDFAAIGVREQAGEER